MGMERIVKFVCDQTGEELVLRHGDDVCIPGRKHPARVSFTEYGFSQSARDIAFALGWQVSTLRELDGRFVTSRKGLNDHARTAAARHWWTAPGVAPCPPYTSTAQAALAKRDIWQGNSSQALVEEVGRLIAELERLREAVA